MGPVCLVGCLCTQKSYNGFALVDVLIKTFRLKGKLSIQDWGKGVWIISFEQSTDRDWIVRNQP
ncbi:hypothetical protein ACS0TY_014064 [Phlomoides rotata]